MRSIKKLKLYIIFTFFLLVSFNLFLISPTYLNRNNSLSKKSEFDLKSSSVAEMWNFTYGSKYCDSALSSNGEYAAVGFDDTLFLLNVSNKQELWRSTLSADVLSIDMSEDGFYIIVGCLNGALYLFNGTISSPKTEIWSTYLGSTPVYEVSITPNGDYFAAICESDVFLFRGNSSTQLWNYTTPDKDTLTVVAVSQNGNYIATGGWDAVLYVFDKASSPSKIPLWNKTVTNGIWDVAFSTDEQSLAFCGGYSVYIYSSVSASQIWEYYTGNDVISLDLSGDRNYLAASNHDGKFFLFNLDTKTLVWEYNSYLRSNTIAISADGSFIAAGSNNDKIYLFNRLTNAVKEPLWNYTTNGHILKISMSSNGRYILAGSLDKFIYMFYNDEPLPQDPLDQPINSYGFLFLVSIFSVIMLIVLKQRKKVK